MRGDGCALVERLGHFGVVPRILISSHRELLPSVNYDRFSEAALSAHRQGGVMLINPITARIEWADRVARQAEQLLIIAKATNDDDMRDELIGYAERLDVQCAWIKASAA